MWVGTISLALLTSMRLLSIVDHHISLQVPRFAEWLPALLTNMRFLPVVNHHMFLQVPRSAERLQALLTTMRLLPIVYHHMFKCPEDFWQWWQLLCGSSHVPWIWLKDFCYCWQVWGFSPLCILIFSFKSPGRLLTLLTIMRLLLIVNSYVPSNA